MNASPGERPAPEIDAYEAWRRRERLSRILTCVAVCIGLVVVALAAVFALRASQNTGDFEDAATKAIWEPRRAPNP